MTDILTPGLRRRLEGVEGRYQELERKVSDPETTSDRNRIREVGQELSSLAPIVETIRVRNRGRLFIRGGSRRRASW